MDLTERAARLRRALDAKSIAVVGASENNWFSRMVFQNLREMGFEGAVYPVNPSTDSVFGIPTFRSLKDAPVAEVVVVATSRERFANVVADVADSDAIALVALTSGLSESGDPQWIRAEEQAREVLDKAGIVLIGPNGLGFLNNQTALFAWSSPVPWPLAQGDTSFVMESGGLLCGCLAAASAAGLAVSAAACIGNGHAIGTSDWIAAFAQGDTRRIGVMLESMPRWEEFSAAARLARARGIEVFAIKSGRSAKGAEVAATHTGALAGDYTVSSALLKQLGVHESMSMGGLIVSLSLHDRFGPPGGGTLAFVGASGGAMGLVADAMDERGIDLVPFSDELTGQLRGKLGLTTVLNPLDVGGQVLSKPGEFSEVVVTVLRDPQVGALVYVPSLGLPGPELPSHQELLELLALAAAKAGKPVVVTALVGTATASDVQRAYLDRREILVVPTVEHALDGLKTWLADVSASEDPRKSAVAPARRYAVDDQSGSDEVALKALLRDRGMQTPDFITYVPGDGPADAPYSRAALKAATPGLLHKSRYGLVELDIVDASSLQGAESRIVAAAEANAIPLPRLLLEEMAEPGHDVFASITKQPFGVVVTVGAGGVDVEAAGNVGFVGWPSPDSELEDVVRARLPELSTGERQALIASVHSMYEALVAGRFTTLECNPIRLVGGRAIALDAVST